MSLFSEALRSWRNRPGLALVIFAIVSLGIGCNAAVFSWFHRVLVSPFSLPRPDRLVLIGDSGLKASLPDFEDWRQWSSSFQSMAAFRSRSAMLRGRDQEKVIRIADVTADFFRVLEVEPALGRTFLANETDVAVLSHRLWRSLPDDTRRLGRQITLDQNRVTIIGVLASSDSVPPLTEAWKLSAKPDSGAVARLLKFHRVVARLKDEKTLRQAQIEMSAIGNRQKALYRRSGIGEGVEVRPFVDAVLKDARSSLKPLLASAGIIMIFACMSGASLLMVRAVGRREEIAVRMALGASRLRLGLIHVVENLMLTATAGIAGLILAKASAKWVLGFAPLDSLPFRDLTLHPETVIFVLAMAGAIGFIFSVLPFVETSQRSFLAILRGSGTGSSRTFVLLQRWMALCQIALSCVLLTASVLLGATIWNLSQIETGFDQKDLLVFTVSRPAGDRVFIRSMMPSPQLLGRIESQPGVEAACSMRDLPMEGAGEFVRAIGLSLEGSDTRFDSGVIIEHLPISPGYFEVMGVRMVAGRRFEARDQEESEPSAIVNESFVQAILRGRNPVGKSLRWEADGFDIAPVELRVVGIAENTRQMSLTAQPEPQLYVPLVQYKSFFTGPVFRFAVAVRTAGDGLTPVSRIRELINETNQFQVEKVRSMQEIVEAHFVRPQAYLLYLGVFAAFALLMSAMAVSAIVVHWIKTRRHEIGLRMALGSTPRRMKREVTAPVAWVALAGVVVGLGASYLTNRFLHSVLHGVTADHPGPYLLTGIAVLGLSLAVSFAAASLAPRVNISNLLRRP